MVDIAIDSSIRLARRVSGITQSQAADQLGFSKRSLMRWENRQVEPQPVHRRLVELWVRNHLQGAGIIRD